MDNNTDGRRQEALSLLDLALCLLKPQPLVVPEDTKLLLTDWIQTHVTQWRHYWMIHDAWFQTSVFPKSYFESAVKAGHVSVSEWLLEANPYDRFTGYEMWAAIRYAEFGHFQLFQATMSRVPPQELQQCFTLSLTEACKQGHMPIVKWLLSVRSPPSRLCVNPDHPASISKEFDEYVDAMLASIEHGHADILELLHAHNRITLDMLRAHGALGNAAKHGHAHVIQWLRRLGLTAKDARYNMALQKAVMENHAQAVRALYDMGLTAEDARMDDNSLLQHAASHNHPKVLARLSAMGLTAEDARSHNNAALMLAATKGYVCVLRKLRAMGLNVADARFHQNKALKLSSENGHADVVEELFDMGLTVDDVRCDNLYAFRFAVINGHVDVLKVMRERANLTLEDLRYDNNFALRSASTSGRTNVIRELRAMGLTVEDARCAHCAPLRLAATHGHEGTIQELKDMGLTREDAQVSNEYAMEVAKTHKFVSASQIVLDVVFPLQASTT